MEKFNERGRKEDLEKQKEEISDTANEIFTKWSNINSISFYNLDPFEKKDLANMDDDSLKDNIYLDLQNDKEDEDNMATLKSIRESRGKNNLSLEIEARSKYNSAKETKKEKIINEFGKEKLRSLMKDVAELITSLRDKNKLLSYVVDNNSWDFFQAGNYIVGRHEGYDEIAEQEESPEIVIKKIADFTKGIKEDLNILKIEAESLQGNILSTEKLLKKLENK